MTPPRPSRRPNARRERPRSGSARVSRSGDRREQPRSGSARVSRPGDRREQPRAGSRRDERAGDRRSRAKPAPPRTQRREPIASDPERLVGRQPWASLRPLLAGAPGGEEAAIAKLRVYALELLKWNRGVSNLISRNDETRLVGRHIAESLVPAGAMRDSGCQRWLDLGSGAGLPAIPLAIAGVGEGWELVESRRNKTLFMRK